MILTHFKLPTGRFPLKFHEMPKRIQKPPRHWRKEIAFILISQEQLARRVHALARQIEKDFAGRDLVIVALLNGTVVFLADLLRRPFPAVAPGFHRRFQLRGRDRIR